MLTLTFLTILALSLLIHWRQSRKDSKYITSLFLGRRDIADRSLYLDYLRLLSVVMAIAVHTLESASGGLARGSSVWTAMTAAACLCLTCNLLFVMVSGALILNGRRQRLLDFYCKRAARVAIPLVAYYCFYLLVHGGVSHFYPKNLWDTILQIVSGAPDGAPHLWLIYVILSLYLTAPFFRVMASNMSDHMMTALALLILVFQGLTTYLPVFHVPFGLNTMLTTWEGVFLLGQFWNRKSSQRYYRSVLVLGCVSFLLSVLWIKYYPNYEAVIYNGAPTMILMASAVFALFSRYRERFRRPGIVLRALNRYSYSILLVHWFVLFYIVRDRLSINAMCFVKPGLKGIAGILSIPAGVCLTVACTLGISFVFAFIYDNTVILCAETALRAAAACAGRPRGSSHSSDVSPPTGGANSSS